ncbi:MAG: MFS transporter [Bdellovibrionales bacterium]|nr:MFS transporter [Bdellovibrionales bacterium]
MKNRELKGEMIVLLALGAGVSVSTLYYAQPMLSVIREDLNTNISTTSLIPSLTQMGYAIGIFFLAPLGDRYDRKNIISTKLILLILALIASFFAKDISVLIGASFIIGLMATAAQDFVPAAAILSKEQSRGKSVGMVMTGLLLGILLSRVLSGAVSEKYGWRVVYVIGAASIFILLAFSHKYLPNFKPTTDASYKHLMKSLIVLWKKHSDLRHAAIQQAILAVAFSAFWSTLAIMLNDRYQLGPMMAGAFGVAGAAGTMAAPIAGRLSDKYGPQNISLIGTVIGVLFFALLFLINFISKDLQIVLLIVSAVGFDFGIQTCLISHQTIVYGIDINARSRLNAILMSGMFIGMSIGAWLGGYLYGYCGIMGLAILATASCFLVLILKIISLSLITETKIVKK